FNKFWQVTRVINMRVADNDGIYGGGVDGKGFPVAYSQRFQSLEQSAIKHESEVAHSEQVSRSGNTAGAAEEFYAHIHAYRLMSNEPRFCIGPSFTSTFSTMARGGP